MLVGVSCVEVKTEADSIAVTECSQDDNSTIGMFPISDDIFSVFGAAEALLYIKVINSKLSLSL